jgi:hypothetical protein
MNACIKERVERRTLGDGLNPSPSSQKVRTDDTSEDGQRDYASPPADNVTDHVNLTLGIVLRPEGDTRKKEGPVDRVRRIGMGSGQTGIVLEHQRLEFDKLEEEVHGLDFLRLSSASTVEEVFAVCRTVFISSMLCARTRKRT